MGRLDRGGNEEVESERDKDRQRQRQQKRAEAVVVISDQFNPMQRSAS